MRGVAFICRCNSCSCNRKTLSSSGLRAATAGIECRKDRDVIDETPAACADSDALMAAQRDLVEVVHTLWQVMCVRG